MKTLLTLFVLLFSSTVFADDISDFQIEGMSIGDSLLDYFSEEEIMSSRRNYFEDKRQYYVVGIGKNLKIFDVLDIYLESNDKKFEIKTLVGKFSIENKKSCLKKKEEITKDINKLFKNKTPYNDIKNHEIDNSGESKQYISQFNFDSFLTNIRVECNFYSKKIKDDTQWEDSLNIIVTIEEISNWIFGGYK